MKGYDCYTTVFIPTDTKTEKDTQAVHILLQCNKVLIHYITNICYVQTQCVQQTTKFIQ